MPENDLKLPSRSYWDGFKARNASLIDKIAYSGNNFTEFIGLAPIIRYLTGDQNTTSTEAMIAPITGTANVVGKGVQKAAPVVKEAAEQAVEQLVKRRGRPPKAVDRVTNLSKLSNTEAKKMYDALMQQQQELLRKLELAETMPMPTTYPSRTQYRQKLYSTKSGSWLGGEFYTPAPTPNPSNISLREEAVQMVKDQINDVNSQIRALSDAGYNFTGYVDDIASAGLKPNQQYAQALDGTVGYELKPRLKSKAKAKKAAETAVKSEPKAMSEIEIMAKDKANKVQIAVDNRKYAKAGRKYDNSGATRKRSDYETTGRKNIREGKDAYGNRRGTQYHDIENYNLGYRWDYKTGLQGNINRLKKHLSEKHSDLVYHEESLFKYLEKNFPEQFKEASKKASGR